MTTMMDLRPIALLAARDLPHMQIVLALFARLRHI
jgi:hypothetical protein